MLNVHSVWYALAVIQSSRDATRSRAAILDAAEAVFAEKGYHGATFTDICKTASVSRGLPTYLFGGKDELYRAVVGRAAARLHASTLDPLRRYAQRQSTSIAEAIELAVDTYVDYLNANRRIVRLLQWEMLSDPNEQRPFAPSAELFAEFRDALKTILKNNELTDVSASDLLSSIVSLCFFPFMLGLGTKVLGPKPFGKAELTRRKNHIVRILLRGITC